MWADITIVDNILSSPLGLFKGLWSVSPRPVIEHFNVIEDNQLLVLYAKWMTTREIAVAFKEMYDADASPVLKTSVSMSDHNSILTTSNRE